MMSNLLFLDIYGLTIKPIDSAKTSSMALGVYQSDTQHNNKKCDTQPNDRKLR